MNTNILQQHTKHCIKQKNTTKAKFINLHATLAIDHTSDKQA